MKSYASQFEFRPAGRGFVRVVLTNRGKDKEVEVLHYAQQGQLVGSRGVDVETAEQLNAAAEALNEALRDLGGWGPDEA